MAEPPRRRRAGRKPPRREAGDPPGSPVSVSAHALDVLLKLEAEHLVPLLPARFGVQLAPIRRQLPTELPQLDLHLERLDRVFELEDSTVLDLEFEAELSVADLRRFVGYGLGLLDAYPGQPAHTLVLCGRRTRAVPAPMDLAPIPYKLTCVRLGDQDGEATLARLRTLAAGGGAWGPADRLDLALLPLMAHERPTEAVVREGLALAQALPEAERARPMGALLALAYHEEGAAALDRLMEELMSTSLLDQIFAEKLEQRFALGVQQGIEQGVQQGIEQGVQQGVQQGVAQGLQLGRAEEARLLLRRYLERRFGAVPPALEARIAAADVADLDALFDRALAVEGIEAL